MAFSSKHIQASAVCQFVKRNWDLIGSFFALLILFLLICGLGVYITIFPDYVEIGVEQYSDVSHWYSDEHARPLISSVLSDGEISLSEYYEIRDTISEKAKLIRLIQEDN
ncbi:hypothetical protein [Vibrio furnissii]|uniref:hypothetical protein n=1 Tax=Vibrio furnissii TaxID=29494 RepID=UPI0025743304|nr:hypothetical protein [Vibrio furnissii]WJG23872.1 hypothetical protein QSU95_23015 [Vibrio furnissii]